MYHRRPGPCSNAGSMLQPSSGLLRSVQGRLFQHAHLLFIGSLPGLIAGFHSILQETLQVLESSNGATAAWRQVQPHTALPPPCVEVVA